MVTHIDSQQHDIEVWGRIAARNRNRKRRLKVATVIVCMASLMMISTIVERFGAHGILVLAILTVVISVAWLGRKA